MRLFHYTVLPINEQRIVFPKWLSNNAIAVYMVLLLAISMVFFQYAMEWYFMLMGVVEVAGFFYFANYLTKEWGAWKSSKKFAKQLFWTAVGIRLVWVVFSYFFYKAMTGLPFEFGAADVIFYDEMGRYGHRLINEGRFLTYSAAHQYSGTALSDYGYPLYLSIVYTLTGNSVLLTRIIKCFLSAWTAVMMYRIASRNFGEKVGRMTGIVCMLMPNLIYYCGIHLKETEMVFLTVAAVNQADQLLRERKFNLWKTLPMVICMASLFLFRTALAAVAILSLLCALIFTSTKVASWGKRIVIALLAVGLLGTVVGNRVQEEVSEIVVRGVGGEQQKINMQWRAEREGGNSFASYAGAAVFAPLIFTIPFPTMVATPNQENLRMIHGGNFIKNISSFFTILAILMFLLSGEWRKYVLPLSFMLGYLVVLVFSNFAQSERFHLPVLCFELMFASFAICQCRIKEKRWFNYWLVIVFVANLGWAWIKLRGRGLS